MSTHVVVLSGGMDSTVLLYDILTSKPDEPAVSSCVSFNYGQRHSKELDFAQATAKKFGLKHHIINLWSSGFTGAISESESSLVTDNDVPEGHYAQDNMKATVVPNRNMVMLSIATSIAVAEGAQYVATAVHAGDHFIYPDCRPQFINALSIAVAEGNEGFGVLDANPILAPYIYQSKEEIAYRGLELGVNFATTWSCYKGGDIHCGKCGTCVERLEAIELASEKFNYGQFQENGRFDDTEYEDDEFWKAAVKL